jgi:hypothetical protein
MNFSIYLPYDSNPHPINDCVIDIIEEVNPNENDFNFYGIELNDVKVIELITN